MVLRRNESLGVSSRCGMPSHIERLENSGANITLRFSPPSAAGERKQKLVNLIK
jgi:hypothetical protein